jgi:hypothetical protein
MNLNLQSEANKHQAHWASIRQTLALCHRSEIVPDFQINAIEQELRDILDSRILVYPPTLSEYGIDKDTSFEDKKDLLQVATPQKSITENEKKFMESMQDKADKARKHNWRWRIAQEAVEKQELGWYPFFVTLTIDPKKFPAKVYDDDGIILRYYDDPADLWKQGRELRIFIRRLVNIVCKELKHPPAHKKAKNWKNTGIDYDYRPESNYLTYAGVLEHGASREHHHGHFLIWMREIPDHWKQCPNRHIKNPKYAVNNECHPITTEWPWSRPDLSKANYFRTIGDIWLTKHNFCTPIDPIKNKPMKIAPANYAGAYVTKYLQKGHKEWHHRMKCTRNLGLNTLKKTIQKLPPDKVEALTWRSETSGLNHLLTTIHSLPLGLLRQIAKQVHYCNLYRSNQLELKNLIENKSLIYTKMLSSVRSGARPDRMPSMEFYAWVVSFLPDQKGYCEKRLIESHQLLSEKFPKTFYTPTHTSIGANKIEHTQRISNWSKKTGSSQSKILRTS